MLEMEYSDKKGVAVWVLAAFFLLSACGGQQLRVEKISKSENPQQLINGLDHDIALARKNQINVLSPTWFARAEESLTDAKKALDRGDELSEIFDSIAVGRAQLQQAQEFARVSQTSLADAIKSRNLARAAGATSLGEAYAEAEDRFLGLTEAIEDNNLSYARRNQSRVADLFRKLELRAIKVQTLGEVRVLLQKARKTGAAKIAPQSYAVARKKLLQADAFITKNPYQKEKMHELAEEALFMARRVLEVARQSRQLETMRPEQITLWVEGILYQTSSKLSAPDMRDRPVDQQVANILASISAQEADRKFMIKKVKGQRDEIEQLQHKIATLQGLTRKEQKVKERLLAEKHFNQQLSSVQNFFKPTEAEVYKKKNQLIIRLKAMHFPVGQSVILPENYALLSKVQRAIRMFGEPDVVIGGHTDSTGSEELNEHLSQQRADAVRQYFVANGTLPFDKIIAVGYGSMRPLASNATEAGRAINRRIDITITPHFNAGQ